MICLIIAWNVTSVKNGYSYHCGMIQEVNTNAITECAYEHS